MHEKQETDIIKHVIILLFPPGGPVRQAPGGADDIQQRTVLMLNSSVCKSLTKSVYNSTY